MGIVEIMIRGAACYVALLPAIIAVGVALGYALDFGFRAIGCVR